MIRLNRSAKPTVLVTHGATWKEEYLAWLISRIGAEPRRYTHQEIRDSLEAETHSKCAYCEARINDVSYTHIEHKLPKKKHPHLVCEWDNLTIGCPRCNTNKGDYDDPACQVLDPHIDDVEREIAFFGPLALPRGGARARLTVRRLGLNRKDLIFNRAEVLQRLDDLLDLVERAGDDVALARAFWADIEGLATESAEFASACRYFVRFQQAERGLVKP